MTTHNLAAIFQPGILSHPQHDMSPQDYRLSQDVLIFLIDNQDHFLIGMEGTAVDEGTVKHIESGPSTPQARTPTTPGRNNSSVGRSASTTSSAGAESVRRYNGVRRNVSTCSKRSRHSGAVPSPITPAFATPTASGVHRSNTLPSKRSPALNSPRFPKEKSGPSTPSTDEPKNPLTTPISAEAAAIVASLGPVSRQPNSGSGTTNTPTSVTPELTSVAPPPRPETVNVRAPAKPVEETPEQLPKRALTMPPQRIEMPPAAPLTAIPQGRPAMVTPAMDQIPGAFPLPSPGIIPPSEDVTPNATTQAASGMLPLAAPNTGLRSPQLTPTRERLEFMEGPVDSGPEAEQTPATRTFTQILSNLAASPSSDAKEGRKPNKLQKKRIPSSAISSAHSSTHSLTGRDIGVGMVHIPPPQQSPLHPPQPPFAGYSQASGSRDALQSHNNDAVSSRNSGTTLKPSMSPSGSYRSHSTATEYSETADPSEEIKEEKKSFWKGHQRGESRATPTASQTDLHGSVPGGDKSMSSFGSSSGWGASGSRRSLQYDSHQNSDLSTAYGSPPDHEKPEKKGSAFDWLHKMKQDHKERSDRRERAKSPPGSSGLLPSPQNLRAPQDNAHDRGRSIDASRLLEGGPNEATPTGSVPQAPSTSTVLTQNPAAAPVGQRHEAQPTFSQSSSPLAFQMQPVPTAQPVANEVPASSAVPTTVPEEPQSGTTSQAADPRPTTPIHTSQPMGFDAPSYSSPPSKAPAGSIP